MTVHPHRTRLSLLHRSAKDRLVPIVLIIMALWAVVGWAADWWPA
jgi:hypothetical protein